MRMEKGEMNLKGKSKIEQPRCPKTAGVVPTLVVRWKRNTTGVDQWWAEDPAARWVWGENKGPLSSDQCSKRSGGPGGPTGKLPRRLDRTRRQFLLRPVLGHFRTAGLSKDNGPHKVRHYYAVLTKGPQGTVVDCRSPDKNGGDL